ncbi:PIH1 domain-containing protein 2 isoform X1 [Scleropages formosus]|uniref:PIH1 domain containing 2 n=2 Tax=Scleropages formosus TaxID=113540 RepID=A0A8C9U445_SCLFO|nr:PIH1 domain-containing protein 2 isoform X1 [Scleropages formosus]
MHRARKRRFIPSADTSIIKMAAQCQEATLQQVEQLWAMLDDMLQSDPESYRTFIQHQLKEGADLYSPPQPNYCLRTRILEPEEGWLYINVCGWRRVPPPQSPSHPVPLFGGRLETVTEGQDTYHVLDVAFNPEVIHEAVEDGEDGQLPQLALSYAQQQHKLRLSEHYTLDSASLKGSLKSLWHRLTFLQKPTDPEGSLPHGHSPGPTLLQQISTLRGRQTENGDDFAVALTAQQQDRLKGKALIQVISSTETTQPRQPDHELTLVAGPDGSPMRVHLTVHLPGVHSVSECQLSISQVLTLTYLHYTFIHLADTFLQSGIHLRENYDCITSTPSSKSSNAFKGFPVYVPWFSHIPTHIV